MTRVCHHLSLGWSVGLWMDRLIDMIHQFIDSSKYGLIGSIFERKVVDVGMILLLCWEVWGSF